MTPPRTRARRRPARDRPPGRRPVNRARDNDEIGIERSARAAANSSCAQLDARARLGPASLGRAGVADEQQLGIEIEPPQRRGRLKCGSAIDANADLLALRARPAASRDRPARRRSDRRVIVAPRASLLNESRCPQFT